MPYIPLSKLSITQLMPILALPKTKSVWFRAFTGRDGINVLWANAGNDRRFHERADKFNKRSIGRDTDVREQWLLYCEIVVSTHCR